MCLSVTLVPRRLFDIQGGFTQGVGVLNPTQKRDVNLKFSVQLKIAAMAGGEVD